mmetsp:Transcript_75599/g.179659  ORF Transcript_75599/g.179659 Transcript_75599/m.179659 type:complete len:207 (+) Transcript_75599:70-690(+)
MGSDMMQYDCLVKLLLIGDSGVGKSCLLGRFTEDKWASNLAPTIGIDFRVKMMEFNGQRVKIQIWDTAGQERFHTITQQYYRNAMGVVMVYDVTNEASFENIRKWVAQVNTHGREGADRVLVGNKADGAAGKRAVSKETGEALAEEYGVEFFETSAKEGKNVEEAFIALAKKVFLKQQEEKPEHERVTTVTITGGKTEKKRCCGGE